MTTTAVQQSQATRQTSATSQQSRPKGIAIQAKLTIGKPNDKYEQEADRIADQVMRMPDRTAVQRKCTDCEKEEKVQQKPLAAGITPWVQRQAKEEEETIQPKPMLQKQTMEEEEPLQTKSLTPESSVLGASLESRLNSSKSGGSPLPDTTRSFMEQRIGTDFSNVKIHTGSDAVQMSRELGAQAFTHGNHIYFNSGKYSPESASGKHLLAHEMVHTVQQRGDFSIQTQRISTNEERASCPKYEGKGFMHQIRKLGRLHPNSVKHKKNYKKNFILSSVKTDFQRHALKLARAGYYVLLCVNKAPRGYKRFNDLRYICLTIDAIRHLIHFNLPKSKSISEINELLVYINKYRIDFNNYLTNYSCK